MQDVTPIRDEKWPKGYYDKTAEDMIPDGYCATAQNCFFDEGNISEAGGYTMIANDTGEGKPNLGLHPHETTTHNQLLKVNTNAGGTAANLFYWTGTGSWVIVAAPTFTANLPVFFCTAQGKTYITNGVDVVKAWDGTTLTNVPAIPKGRILVWFHNYLWSLHETVFKSRANFSNLGAPETFTAGDFIDINPDDNDFIIGATSFKDELYIGKRYRTYAFQGWTEADFTVMSINERLSSFGLTSANGYSAIGNDLLFPSFNGEIPHLRSLAKTKFSDTEYGGVMTDAIQGTMKIVSKGELDNISTVFDGRYVWMFFSTNSTPYNDTCVTLDTVSGGFSKHKGYFIQNAVVSTVQGYERVYMADSRNAKVYVRDNGNSLNGDPIEMIFESRTYKPDFKHLYKFKYLYMGWQAGSSGTLYVYTAIDEFPYDLVETIPLSILNSQFSYTFPFGLTTSPQRYLRVNLPYATSSTAKMKFYKNDTAALLKLTDYEFEAQRKPLRAFYLT